MIFTDATGRELRRYIGWLPVDSFVAELQFVRAMFEINRNQFAVAAELSPPRGVNLEAIARDAGTLKDYTDAVNVTDNQAASVRSSNIE